MRSVTDVEAVNTLVYFRATTTDRRDAIGIANAVARAYPNWRAGVYGKTIDAAIKRIEALDLDASGGAISEQLQRLNVLKTLNSGSTLLVEPADDAAQITPRLIRDAVLGAAIGLIIALLLAGIRELLDTRVRSEADVEEALGVPVLATIRTLPRRARNRVAMADDRVADTYDLLAANLAQILEQHERPVYVAVTSAEPGEGKTTTSANLALALARRGQDVVLADFDLRKPGLAPLFSVSSGAPGVADVLRGDASVSSILRPIAISSIGPRAAPLAAGTSSRGSVRVAPPRKDREGSLLFLPGGRPGSAGSGGDFARLPKLLDEFEMVADFVIIDTPPALLTAGVAELAQSMTAVLIVVRQGEVPQRRLRALAGRSRTWRDKIVGAVLNGSAAEERYSSYYGRE
jgi:Mrp family chromosome partitioning ATPase